MVILQSSKGDWDPHDCPGWYSYEYQTVGLREVSPAHRGGRNYSGAIPRAHESVNVFRVIGFQTMFVGK